MQFKDLCRIEIFSHTPYRKIGKNEDTRWYDHYFCYEILKNHWNSSKIGKDIVNIYFFKEAK